MRSPHKSVLRHLAAALLMVLVTLSVGAYAQVDIFESGQNAELSEKLFTEGRSLWKKGKHLEACAKFRESSAKNRN